MNKVQIWLHRCHHCASDFLSERVVDLRTDILDHKESLCKIYGQMLHWKELGLNGKKIR